MKTKKLHHQSFPFLPISIFLTQFILVVLHAIDMDCKNTHMPISTHATCEWNWANWECIASTSDSEIGILVFNFSYVEILVRIGSHLFELFTTSYMTKNLKIYFYG